MDAPEPYSNEWYRRRLNRLETALDRQDNELRDQYKENTELKMRLEKMERDYEVTIKDMQAKIGELNGRLEDVESKHKKLVDRLAEKFKEKNGAAA